MSEPVINFGPKANKSVVSNSTLDLVNKMLKEAKVSSCTITSTSRTPADQARAMFNNLEAKGIKSQLDLYAAAGDEVINVYAAKKRAKKTPEEIKAAMEAKIIAVGPSHVSRHCADPAKLNVLDISPSSISDKRAFEKAITAKLSSGKISKFLSPSSGDPAYHIEIPQAHA